MVDWGKASIVAAAACGAAACGIAAFRVATRSECTVVPPPVVEINLPPPEPPPTPPAPPANHDVVSGDLELSWVPAGYVRRVGAAKTAALARLVADWAGESARIPIEHRRGIAYVQSEVDMAVDVPRSKAMRAEALRACGSPAQWLRATLRETLANKLRDREVTCHENVCSWSGMEYDPAGYIVFRSVDDAWVLDAYFELYATGLVLTIADRNRAAVAAGLKRLAGSGCPGEPPGSG